jgi:hypothetical protein
VPHLHSWKLTWLTLAAKGLKAADVSGFSDPFVCFQGDALLRARSTEAKPQVRLCMTSGPFIQPCNNSCVRSSCVMNLMVCFSTGSLCAESHCILARRMTCLWNKYDIFRRISRRCHSAHQ